MQLRCRRESSAGSADDGYVYKSNLVGGFIEMRRSKIEGRDGEEVQFNGWLRRCEIIVAHCQANHLVYEYSQTSMHLAAPLPESTWDWILDSPALEFVISVV